MCSSDLLPLFKGADPLLLNAIVLALHSKVVASGETIIERGDTASEMYLICRGDVEVLDAAGAVKRQLKDGDFFGEIGLLMATPRTATVRAKSSCDLFVLQKTDFRRILQDHPQFADQVLRVARERYDVTVSTTQLLSAE